MRDGVSSIAKRTAHDAVMGWYRNLTEEARSRISEHDLGALVREMEQLVQDALEAGRQGGDRA